LPRLLLGILFARGRRTVTSWFRAAGITDEFRPAYRTVCAVGDRIDPIAASTLRAVRPLLSGQRLTVAIDDTPTPRYGPEGAGGAAGAGADLRQAAALSGQAGGAPAGLAACGVRAVRRGRDQDGQDVPGDVASGRGADPCGAGPGERRLGGLLLHQAGGDGRG